MRSFALRIQKTYLSIRDWVDFLQDLIKSILKFMGIFLCILWDMEWGPHGAIEKSGENGAVNVALIWALLHTYST